MTLTERFFDKLSSVMKNKELKDRIVFTLLMFLVARIGTHIPAPGVDIERLGQMTADNDILSYLNMFSGGAFKSISIFALGIVPYINASIVFSLLSVIIPRIEEIQKEGESGRSKIAQWTRYVTILIAIVQGFATCTFLRSQGLVTQTNLFSFHLTTITILTAGTIFLMWIGEQITISGVGNGVSLLIFLNVISGAPSGVLETIQKMQHSRFLIPVLILVALLMVAVVSLIVLFQLGQRKIPIHYVGKGYGRSGGVGDKSYIPLKLNSAGVMPVIFASVAMILVSGVNRFLPTLVDRLYSSFGSDTISKIPTASAVKVWITRIFGNESMGYYLIFALIIIFFSFFYTAIVFDPEKVADNLKQGGGTIPGIRPGTETVEYLEGVVERITWGGAFFLAGLSILPPILFKAVGLPVFFQGTGIIIVVGVAIDTIEQINAHLVMRDYKGFL